jgi:uncharacterized protein
MLPAVALALLLQATPAQIARIRWVPNPRTAGGAWVADPSHHLRDSTITLLNAEIGALERQTGAEIAVVVVDSTAGLEPFDFALALHRGWGVGKAGRDNGIVFLWIPTQRAVQISVGYGLEGAIPDRRAGRIRDEDVFPAFQRGEFDVGVLAGVRSLAEAARADSGGTRRGFTPRVQGGETAAEERRGGGPGGVLAVPAAALGGLATLIGGFVGFRRWRRRRPRPCPNGHGDLRLLDERADDEKLDQGSRREEQIGSVDWDVWVCDQCKYVLRIPYRAFGSPYHDCPTCHHRTLSVVEHVVSQATHYSEGSKRVVQHCTGCGWRSENLVAIPVLVAASSSSSSFGGGGGGGGGGGSSFGGGSAGGGGAGGKY